jgi:catechol 2,3-dioxygenase-like lactoylglutathione lyase family enzyme
VELTVRRIIVFTDRMDVMTAFYRDVIGLAVAGREDGWIDFAAGDCHVALHAGGGKGGKRQPKIAFFAKDVAVARATLVKRGAKMGKVMSAKTFDMCDGVDPDGNPFQISSRR